MLTHEMTILALYGLLVALTLLGQATGAATQLDMGYLLSSRDEKRTLEGMAGRFDRALNNSVVAMALFAPAILILNANDAFSPDTLILAQLFLGARVLYLPAYVFNLVGFRTLFWLIGFASTVLLLLLAL
ncbi:MAPEG family protein [Solirhodobacter olei]|uniref:MAPEG family protein n=1 Tax=Solirhodobacter olei TaxID=2493082 RepID=UPI000FD88F28|nr:MAPEG family protein [Solirhodobacter olei]